MEQLFTTTKSHLKVYSIKFSHVIYTVKYYMYKMSHLYKIKEQLSQCEIYYIMSVMSRELKGFCTLL